MTASLDTNTIIHFYRAGCESSLFQCFCSPLYIHAFLLDTELEHHGKDILGRVRDDINSGKILCISESWLRERHVYGLFIDHVRENSILYSAKDMGEVYAISLAQTLGIGALVTDDIKQGGPYMSLLAFEEDVMPFYFMDILILNYLAHRYTAYETVNTFNKINTINMMKWSFSSHIKRFVRRFWYDPYTKSDKKWIKEFCEEHSADFKSMIMALDKAFHEDESI